MKIEIFLSEFVIIRKSFVDVNFVFLFCFYVYNQLNCNGMSSKRKTGDMVLEEGFGSEAKRQRVVEEQEVESSPSPPPLPIANPLSGLANYDDDDEEEEEERQGAEQNGGGKGVENDNGGQGIEEEQEEEEEEEEEEDQNEQGYGQGRRNREVERRRDCPYLDTVNRQVYYSSLMLKIN